MDAKKLNTIISVNNKDCLRLIENFIQSKVAQDLAIDASKQSKRYFLINASDYFNVSDVNKCRLSWKKVESIKDIDFFAPPGGNTVDLFFRW